MGADNGRRRPRILLLQARRDADPMRGQELHCFIRRTGLPPENVRAHDLCDGTPGLDEVLRHDALMIGGSGDYNVTERNLPGHERFLELMREVTERGHPTFASCFGYQAIVQALGGEVVRDSANTEIGTLTLTLTDEGRADPLFCTLPATFTGQFGHKERASTIPAGLPNLASTDRVAYQALRVPGKPVWGTQFHPELDRASNLERFETYAENYAPEMLEQKAKILRLFRESPESSALLARFLRLVFG